MKSISTHILDISRGKPAMGVPVTLEFLQKDFSIIARSRTDTDGRIRDWQFNMAPGTYRLRFEVAEYYAALNETSFYPYIEIVFKVENASQHYHVPVLLTAFGYSTYRGS